MKKILFSLSVAVLLFACSDRRTEAEHPQNHSQTIYFEVYGGDNISSYNIYENDNLIGQMSSTQIDVKSSYSFKANDITEHPYEVAYSVEPIYMDTSSTAVKIELRLSVDGTPVASEVREEIPAGEVVKVSYSGK